MINKIQDKLSEYFGAVKSRTHAQYYILNQRDLEQDVFRMDKERALGKLRMRQNGRNIRKAQQYDSDDNISSIVRDCLNQRHAGLIAIYEAFLDSEHASTFKGNYYGISGHRKWSNLFANAASYARKQGDESIEQRRTIERLLRALDNGLEDYITLLAELYPKY